MTTCPECGHNNMPGVAFCDDCGYDLSAVSAPQPTLPQPNKVAPTAPVPPVSAPDPFGDPFGDPFQQEPVQSAPVPVSAVTPVQPAAVTDAQPVVQASPEPAPDADLPPVAPQQSPVGPSAGTAELIIERNGQVGQRYPVSHPTLIGKWDMDAGNFPEIDTTKVDPEGYISRRHALIEQVNGQWTIQDLGSTNGTALNRQKLKAMQPQVLQDGDEVIIGRLFLRFHT